MSLSNHERGGDLLRDLQLKRIMAGRQFEKDFLASLLGDNTNNTPMNIIKSFAKSLKNRIGAIKAVLTPNAKPSDLQFAFSSFLANPHITRKEFVDFSERLNDELLALEVGMEERYGRIHAEPVDVAASRTKMEPVTNEVLTTHRKRKQHANDAEVICIDSDSEPEKELNQRSRRSGPGDKKKKSNPITPSPSKKSRRASSSSSETAASRLGTHRTQRKLGSGCHDRENEGVMQPEGQTSSGADVNQTAAAVKEEASEDPSEQLFDLTGEDSEEDEARTVNTDTDLIGVARQVGEVTPPRVTSRDHDRSNSRMPPVKGGAEVSDVFVFPRSEAVQKKEEQRTAGRQVAPNNHEETSIVAAAVRPTCVKSGGTLVRSIAVEEPPEDEDAGSVCTETDLITQGDDASANSDGSQLPDSTASSTNISIDQAATTDGIAVKEPSEVVQADDADEAQLLTPDIKEENTRKEAKKNREVVYGKYRNRYLLARQSPLGIGRLGGSVQETYPKPSLWNKQIWDSQKRLKRGYPFPKHLDEADLLDGRKLNMDAFHYMAYNSLWNLKAPQYAGQPFAAVTGVAQYFQDNGLAFPVFMSRQRQTRDAAISAPKLGWEYVGNYKVVTPGSNRDFWESAENYGPASRQLIEKKVLKSSKARNGYGRVVLDRWRDKLTKVLEDDDKKKDKSGNLSPSEPGPKYMVENREPTAAEKDEKPPCQASRVRALSFRPDMPDEEFVTILMRLDEYHGQIAIEFVEYDERIYEWCEGGKTTRDAEGKLVRDTHQDPAKAGDWYNWAEQHMLM